MRKFTLMLLAAMFSLAASAQLAGTRKAPALPKSTSSVHVAMRQAARQSLAKSHSSFEGLTQARQSSVVRRTSAAGEEVVTPPEASLIA